VVNKIRGKHFTTDDFVSGGNEGAQRSHYALESDLETVLKIRTASFPGAAVSGDDTYRECFKINPQSFKLVEWSGQYIGYWGIIPTTRDYYFKMCNGELSHAEMLTDGVISWADVDPDNVYVYIIGIVTLSEKYLKIGFTTAARKVLLDAFSTIEQIFSDPRNHLRGVVGYPATKQGLKIVEKRLDDYGFQNTRIYPKAKDSYAIRVLLEKDVEPFLAKVGALLDKFRTKDDYAGMVPAWSKEERVTLVDMIGSPIDVDALPGANDSDEARV
jgi:hypothetical protein